MLTDLHRTAEAGLDSRGKGEHCAGGAGYRLRVRGPLARSASSGRFSDDGEDKTLRRRWSSCRLGGHEHVDELLRRARWAL
jgi:hypothetical protein